MKNKRSKLFISTIVSICFFGGVESVSAHVYNGLMFDFSSLQARQTQVLTLNCPAGTTKLVAQIADTAANKGIMSVTIFKDGLAQTASDLTQGGITYGPLATLSAGAGTYYMIASQTDSVAGGYIINYHCEDADGSETTSTPAVLTQP